MSKKNILVVFIILFIALAGIAFLLRSDEENIENDVVTKKTSDTIGQTVFPSETIAPEASTEPISETAKYKVVFYANWSSETHPSEFPSSAHFSPFIAYSHDNSQGAQIYNQEDVATEGVKVMAETGATGPLEEEIQSKINNNSAYSLAKGERIDSPGITEVELEFSIEKSYLTLVSMIAPSPDWFVALENINLINSSGWEPAMSYDVIVYDAGTDSGGTFTSADLVTSPAENVSLIEDGPLAENGQVASMGKVEIELLDQ